MSITALRAIRAAARPIIPLLVVAALAGAAAAAVPRRAPPRAAGAAATAAGAAILPVPLNPIVPPSQRLCSAVLPSGVGTRVLKPGSAAKPAPTDVVLVNYIGYLAATGAVFDQNREASFPVGGVIKGFAEGLRATGRGGITRICVPAAQGYGARNAGPIPPNSNLVFQVELVDFKTAAEVEALQRAQIPDVPAASVPSSTAVPAPTSTPAH